MNKGQDHRNKQPHIFLLVSLLAFIWSSLLYLYFVVLLSANTNFSVNSPEWKNRKVNTLLINDHDTKRDYPFMRALEMVKNTSDSCGGRYIYVHDLPPRFNDDMLKDCDSSIQWTDMCRLVNNNAGLGPPILENNVESGWYATDQFALDAIFNNRMKQYDCLTNDSTVAAAFFVPFYAGYDFSRHLWGHNVSTRDAASLDLVEWLVKRPEWGIMGGKDHFLVAGRTTWDFRRTENHSEWGNKLLLLPAAKNMSVLVVESAVWNGNDYAIPYPTYFHPAKHSDVLVWQDRMRKLDRKYLFCFAGAPRPNNLESIRGQIIDQCKNSNLCKLLKCGSGENSRCHSPNSIMHGFQSSIFCLQPRGDSYTRRSTFDSMLAGCIPVFFHPGSAYTQYTWHLPNNYSQYAVFIPEDGILSNSISIEERLSRISVEQVNEMREEVINLIPRLIYGDPRSKLDISFKDAFDIAVQGVINKVTRLRRDIVLGRKDENDLIGAAKKWDPFLSKSKLIK